MMNKTPVIGIIGAGMIAEKHISSLQKTKKASIKWIAELREDVLDKVKKTYEIQNGTKDYQDILNDEKVDAVIICTPPSSHKDIFLECLRAKKHILLEKPAAVKPEDISKMVEERQKNPELIVLEASCRHARLQPKFTFAKKIIGSGKLGDIYYIHHNCVFRQGRGGIEYHPTAKWFLNKAVAGGGPLFDWGVYDLSFHLGLLDDRPELESVKTLFTVNGLDEVDPGTDVFDVEEHGACVMEFSGGLRYYWERASNANMETSNETRIYGTKGGLKLNYCSWDPVEVEFFDVADNRKGKARKETLKVDMSTHVDDEYALAEHFIYVLEGKEEPGMPIERAKKHLDIINRVYQL